MQTVRNFHEFQRVLSHTGEILNFRSRDFRVIRFILRLLSLWRPQSAGFLERYVYPVFVSLLLLITGPVRNSLRTREKSIWLNVQLLFIVHEMVVWLGHILGNRYFASRDLEKNVLIPMKPLIGITKPLKRRLKILNVFVVVSMTFFSIMLCTLFLVTRLLWKEGDERFSAQFPNVQGPLDYILYGSIFFSIVYNLGVGLALPWTLALLYCCYAARLKILENIFVKWKNPSVEAVSFFIKSYAKPVRNSWKQISWWFLAHNIVALVIPLYGYELAQAVSGGEYPSKHLPQFICYLIFTVTIWLAPIYVGEQIKKRETKFNDRINDISPWILEAERPDLSENIVHTLRGESDHPLSVTNLPHPHRIPSLDSTCSTSAENSDNDPKYTAYTFVSRGEELRNFLHFLKRRTPGLVSRGYSLQLNLSFVSLIGGFISFLTELHSKNSQYFMERNCNCTMS